MYHMLSCFNLRPGVGTMELSTSVKAFDAHLQEAGLVQCTGPIGKRDKHPVMDTDEQRDLDYYFIMTFSDREQCDRAVEYIYSQDLSAETIHGSVFSKVDDAVFICWEDID